MCMTMTPGHAPTEWTRQCLDHIRHGTWERHVSRMELRGPAIASHPGSPSHRAACWNTHVVTVVPYPAQLCFPSAGHRARMAACLGMLFHTAAWAPWWSVAGLRLYFGVRGAPRCPWTAAAAAGAVSWARRGGWGPAALRDEQRSTWAGLLQWADLAARRQPGTPLSHRALSAARRLLTGARDRLLSAPHCAHRGLGAAAYDAVWFITREDAMTTVALAAVGSEALDARPAARVERAGRGGPLHRV